MTRMNAWRGTGVLLLIVPLLLGSRAESCTLWAAVGEAARAGGSLVVKNRDWRPDHRQEIKRVTPKQGATTASSRPATKSPASRPESTRRGSSSFRPPRRIGDENSRRYAVCSSGQPRRRRPRNPSLGCGSLRAVEIHRHHGKRPPSSLRISPHNSRTAFANYAGLGETLVAGGPGRIRRRRGTVTLRGVRPPPSILPLQAGMATGQVSPDCSRILRE